MSIVLDVIKEIVRQRFEAYQADRKDLMPRAVVFSRAGEMAFKADPEILKYDPMRLFEGQTFYDARLVVEPRATLAWRVVGDADAERLLPAEPL